MSSQDMDTDSQPRSRWCYSRWRLHGHHVVILLFALCVHGLLLLNDGVYYDGWLVRSFIEFGNKDRLQLWFFESGVPHVYYLHLLLGALPGVFAYKLIAFVCIALSGVLTYSIAHESGLVGRLESLLIALVALCYPAFQAAPEITILPFLICYTVFLLAIVLALRAEEKAGQQQLQLTIVALVCFSLSFTIPSLLVYYLGFLCLLGASVRIRRKLDMRTLLSRLATRRLYYVLLPIVFWIMKQVLLPARGSYAEYNQFKLSVYSLIYNFRTFLASSIYDQLNKAVSQLNQPVQWLLLLLVAQGIYTGFRLNQRKLSEHTVRPAARLWFGLSLLLLGIIPYVLVGKAPDVAGFGTRHALLIGLPMAIIIVSLTQLLFLNGNAKDGKTLSHVGWIFLVSLLLLFSSTMINSYLQWQVRWIKSRAVMAALSWTKTAGEYSTYWVHDRFYTGEHDAWVFLEWSSLFRYIWSDETRAGMDVSSPDLLRVMSQTPELLEPPTSGHFNLSNWNPAGPQADLTIERGPAAASNERIVAKYFMYKFLSPTALPQFLQQVAFITATPAAKRRELPLPARAPQNISGTPAEQ